MGYAMGNYGVKLGDFMKMVYILSLSARITFVNPTMTCDSIL